MAGIQEYLNLIETAIYGRDVRQAIHDAIEICYTDAKSGAADTTVGTILPTIKNFEQGSLANGQDDTYRASSRARSKTILCTDSFLTVRAKDTTSRVTVAYFNQSGNYTSGTSWAREVTIRRGERFRLLMTNNVDSPVDESYTNIVNRFEFISDDSSLKITSVNKITKDLFEHGSLEAGFNDDYRTEARLRTKDLLYADETFIFTVNSENIAIGYYLYTNDGVELMETFLPRTTPFVVTKGSVFRLLILRVNSASYLPIDEAFNLFTVRVAHIATTPNNIIESWCKDGLNQEQKSNVWWFPNCSIMALERAKLAGFTRAVVHVQFTSDNVPVTFHDLAINRHAVNADGTAISETINIADHTLAQLDQYNFGEIGYLIAKNTEKIPRFEDVMAWCRRNNFEVMVEPVATLTDAQENTVLNIIKKYSMQNQIGYFAYGVSILSRFHNKLPQARLFLNVSEESDITNTIDDYVQIDGNLNYYISSWVEIGTTNLNKIRANDVGLLYGVYLGTEPDNYEDVLNNKPYSNGAVTQAIPCDSLIIE